MKNLLYIDACIRGEQSRTRRIAEPIVAALSERYAVRTLVLNELDLAIVDKELLARRQAGEIPAEVLDWANAVRSADRIVIAAPFWDMSIPAALKNFLELCSLFKITFDSDDKTCFGLCRAEKLLFITTRGMDIPTGHPLEQATPYLQALSWLWGIGPLEVVAAQNFDYLPEAVIEEKIAAAVAEGLEIAKQF